MLLPPPANPLAPVTPRRAGRKKILAHFAMAQHNVGGNILIIAVLNQFTVKLFVRIVEFAKPAPNLEKLGAGGYWFRTRVIIAGWA